MSENESTSSTDAGLIERVRRSATAIGVQLDFVALMPKHGSARRYARARLVSGDSRVVMILPELKSATHEVGAVGYDAIAESPFVRVQTLFDQRGIRVPEIYDVDEDNYTMWLEDLGQRDLDQAQAERGDARLALYEGAIRTLLGIQGVPLEQCPASIKTSRFSIEHFEWELEHYVEWRLEKRLGVELEPSLRERLAAEFAQISRDLHELPTVCSHRDFQSHNLMVGEGDEIVAIDFQDALVAPVVYDLVALLRDSYVVLSGGEVRELFEAWFHGATGSVLPREVSLAQAWHWFRLQTIQRKLKDTGRFEYFALHDENDGFLRYLADSVSYVKEALEDLDAYPALTETLRRHEPLFNGASARGAAT